MSFLESLWLRLLLFLIRRHTLSIEIADVRGEPAEGLVRYRIGASRRGSETLYASWRTYGE